MKHLHQFRSEGIKRFVFTAGSPEKKTPDSTAKKERPLAEQITALQDGLTKEQKDIVKPKLDALNGKQSAELKKAQQEAIRALHTVKHTANHEGRRKKMKAYGGENTDMASEARNKFSPLLKKSRDAMARANKAVSEGRMTHKQFLAFKKSHDATISGALGEGEKKSENNHWYPEVDMTSDEAGTISKKAQASLSTVHSEVLEAAKKGNLDVKGITDKITQVEIDKFMDPFWAKNPEETPTARAIAEAKQKAVQVAIQKALKEKAAQKGESGQGEVASSSSDANEAPTEKVDPKKNPATSVLSGAGLKVKNVEIPKEGYTDSAGEKITDRAKIKTRLAAEKEKANQGVLNEDMDNKLFGGAKKPKQGEDTRALDAEKPEKEGILSSQEIADNLFAKTQKEGYKYSRDKGSENNWRANNKYIIEKKYGIKPDVIKNMTDEQLMAYGKAYQKSLGHSEGKDWKFDGKIGPKSIKTVGKVADRPTNKALEEAFGKKGTPEAKKKLIAALKGGKNADKSLANLFKNPRRRKAALKAMEESGNEDAKKAAEGIRKADEKPKAGGIVREPSLPNLSATAKLLTPDKFKRAYKGQSVQFKNGYSTLYQKGSNSKIKGTSSISRSNTMKYEFTGTRIKEGGKTYAEVISGTNKSEAPQWVDLNSVDFQKTKGNNTEKK